MINNMFGCIFKGPALDEVVNLVRAALNEDGEDLTSNAVFTPDDRLTAVIVAKQAGVAAGLPLADIVLENVQPGGPWEVEHHMADGQHVEPGTTLLTLRGPARTLLKAERVMLNFIGHLSGVASLTAAFAARIKGTKTTLLDTRKTLPGFRKLEKYAVRMGGGANHRMDLSAMLMLKDTHLDRAGSMTAAVNAMRAAYDPCPPIEVECRDFAEVREAVGLGVSRIMLDNMDHEAMATALRMIPESIETEISGGVNLDTIASIAALGPDFVSAGALTHSAPGLDVSMRIVK